MTVCGVQHLPSVVARPACQIADPIRRNLESVRTGAMVHDAGADKTLMTMRLIRVNRRTGWYDLTPAGRTMLEA